MTNIAKRHAGPGPILQQPVYPPRPLDHQAHQVVSRHMPDQQAQNAAGAQDGARIPSAGTALVHVLQDGYVLEDAGGDRVGSTVTLIVDANVAVVVDPGMVSSRAALVTALAGHDIDPGSVTDVVF